VVNKETNGFGVNASYVAILRAQWVLDPASVPVEWAQYFAASPDDETPVTAVPETKFVAKKEAQKPAPQTPVKNDSEEEVPLLGISKKIAENMEASLGLPTAMSTREIPVKVLEENRRIINSYLTDTANARCSFTHLIAFAMVKAATEVPAMNLGYRNGAKGPVKLVRENMNLGLAIDLPGRGGSRTLVVPNIKSCQDMDFWAFFSAYNDLIKKARSGKLSPADFAGTTITLTNPGGLGTVSSNPRLMLEQGTIVATGRIGYPAEYEATAPETLRALGIGKVMSMTSTYDHRVIQGAESGAYLKYIHELLNGEHGFYDEVFRALKIPHFPYRLVQDRSVAFAQGGTLTETERAMRVSQLIHAFRVRGYLLANTDPLDLQPREHPELNLDAYGLTLWDLDREFLTLGVLPERTAPFRQILGRLRDTYCRRMGVEYMHIHEPEERRWWQQNLEREPLTFSVDEKRRILSKVTEAETFERFLHKRFMGHKRFSIEGGECLIPILSASLTSAATYGVNDLHIGMAHRGRLNVLANVVGKPVEAIFAEFEDIETKSQHGSGDVKYHLGAKGEYLWSGITNDTDAYDERSVRVELACNPSHLEAVSPVVLGSTRARQDLVGDKVRNRVVPVLIHGDAAFAGQGVVYETLQMSGLKGYSVGGTVHVIVNNQIGYTTSPDKARTSVSASDVARAIFCPVLRVNGDDPEDCVRAALLAFRYRMEFNKDVIIDMVCYRKYGHNEGDEPGFTQPVLYRAINEHPSVRTLYADLLVRRKDFTREEVDEIQETYYASLDASLAAIREKGDDAIPEEAGVLPGAIDRDAEEEPVTAVDEALLKQITEKVTYDPKVVDIHPRVIKTVLERRRKMVLEEGKGIDFGMAETLAYGSLLLEGIPVRLSGQDVGRGTFAHRHAILYDNKDGRPYIPLQYLYRSKDDEAESMSASHFRVYDSLLSEEGVLGFEYGYSVTHPDALVIWEAQFGDFYNGAQIQVDQFIASGEVKWGQRSRVALLLPHGYDGQGPEHSSARIERFLQLCAEDNMRVANCSTPVQLFHLLRLQAKQPKKPLVIFSHKSLLRADFAASALEDFTQGGFQTIIEDDDAPQTTQKTILCSGKIYWDLQKERKASHPDAPIRILRLEQLYPFPAAELTKMLGTKTKDVTWVQEEPANGGAYLFVKQMLEELNIKTHYVGRAAAASPATGSMKKHKAQQETIIKAALTEMSTKEYHV
tara:strand:- start:2242 stop:5895 length:3654 start_codon:yes stop_codon:yes gene_type:complete